jgi:single-strand DNA-binding protein
MNEITLIGHVGRHIRLNHSRDNATAVLSFSIAMNDRQFDRRKGDWVERPTVWQDVVAFGARAENAHDSITPGTAVIVVGKFSDNSYTKEGREPGDQDIVIRRTQLIASHIAVDLGLATAKVTKNVRDPETRTDNRNQSERPTLTVLTQAQPGPQD